MTLALVVLAVTNAALVAALCWRAVEDRKERLTLLNRIVATTPAEVAYLDRAASPPPLRPVRPEEDDERPERDEWLAGEQPIGA